MIKGLLKIKDPADKFKDLPLGPVPPAAACPAEVESDLRRA